MRKEEEAKINNNIFEGNFQSNFSMNSKFASNLSNNK